MLAKNVTVDSLNESDLLVSPASLTRSAKPIVCDSNTRGVE